MNSLQYDTPELLARYAAPSTMAEEIFRLRAELARYKTIMPCGHPGMLEILNDAGMPECAVCWLKRTEAEREEAYKALVVIGERILALAKRLAEGEVKP